jgi:hypothetical protein
MDDLLEFINTGIIPAVGVSPGTPIASLSSTGPILASKLRIKKSQLQKLLSTQNKTL